MVAISDILEQARRLHQAGKLAEAERAYSQVLQANGHDAEVCYLIGDALQGQGRLEEAAGRFRQALQLQPSHVAARAGLGVTLAGMRKLPEAVAELRQAVHLRPTSPKRITTWAWPWPNWAISTKRSAAYIEWLAHSQSSNIQPRKGRR
jgi:Flp pilus assembly protein TadD